jgi:hypothetical protein
MRILKLTCPWVIAAALLMVYAGKQPTFSADTLGTEFAAAFRQAHEQHDLEAMRKLFCWDRVTPEFRKATEDELRGDFDNKIVSIKVTTEHPRGRPDVFVRNGVTYRFNLRVVAELVVENPPLSKDAFNGTYYPLGIRDGRYLIAQMAPVEDSETQAKPAPSGPPGQGGKSSQPGKAREGARPTVVPAGTVLMVRLGEDVGLKTIKAGGTFSASVDQAVVVGGVTAIPAGSRVQGMVTKTGDYSPDATLTSVSVNGRPRKISTGNMTFNDAVVFPAGSEMKFELVFPLKLAE